VENFEDSSRSLNASLPVSGYHARSTCGPHLSPHPHTRSHVKSPVSLTQNTGAHRQFHNRVLGQNPLFTLRLSILLHHQGDQLTRSLC